MEQRAYLSNLLESQEVSGVSADTWADTHRELWLILSCPPTSKVTVYLIHSYYPSSRQWSEYSQRGQGGDRKTGEL